MANRLSLAGMTLLVAATTLTACMTEDQLRAEWETRCVGSGIQARDGVVCAVPAE